MSRSSIRRASKSPILCHFALNLETLSRKIALHEGPQVVDFIRAGKKSLDKPCTVDSNQAMSF